MKPQSDIPILRVTDGEVVSGNPPAKVILSSVGTSWPNVLVEQHRIPSFEWNDVEYIQHIVGVNLGRPATTEVRKRGRFRRFYHKTGAISLFPSREPLFGRMKKEKKPPVDALFVALDPIFVSQTAAALEVYPDRVELVGQEARSDRTLRHISMALHAGLKDGRADDSIYGESLSLALAVHLLRKYAGIAMGPRRHRHRSPCFLHSLFSKIRGGGFDADARVWPLGRQPGSHRSLDERRHGHVESVARLHDCGRNGRVIADA
jgi:hypothetical protein